MKLHTRREAQPFPAFPARRTLARLVAGALLVGAQAVHAQSLNLDLPAQSLESALANVARQSGLQLALDPALAAGRSAPALSGQFTTMQAFERLLAGSGLQAVRQGDTLVIQPVPRGDAQLRAVTVTAGVERSGRTEGTGSYTTSGSVTAATGLNLSLRETPQSVTVITRQQMDDQSLNSLGDVINQTPGVSMFKMGAPIGGRLDFFSRGYQITNYQLDGSVATSGTWGDNYGSGLGALDSALYDSVTVVRGATGLLTGAGDPSGSINLVRKKPTDTFQASVEAGLGRWDLRRTTADLSGPLNAAGSLRGRLVAAYQESGHWFKNYEGRQSTLYGVIEADLGVATQLSVALEHGNARANGVAYMWGFPLFYADGSPTNFSGDESPVPEWSSRRSHHSNLTVGVEHEFNKNWQAKLKYTYGKRKTKLREGIIGDLFHHGAEPAFWLFDDESDTHALDASIHGKYPLWGREHDLIVGVSGWRDNKDFPQQLFFGGEGTIPFAGGALGIPEPDWNQQENGGWITDTKQSGAYFSTRLRPSERSAVIIGGRWSNWSTYTEALPGRNYNPDDPNANPIWDDRKENRVFTPYAGFVFDLNQALSIYTSYTEVFNPQSRQDINGLFLDPESGKNYELGLKGEWLGGRLNTNISVFEVRKDNLAVADGDRLTPTGTQAYIAHDKTKGRGWEVEVAGLLAPGWQVQGGYTRVVVRDGEGNRLDARRPAHQFKLFTAYTPRNLPRLTVGGGINWQSKTYADFSWYSEAQKAHTSQSGYAVVNLMARYEISDQLGLTVGLGNVFDSKYRTSFNNHEYGAGRNLVATLKYQF